jgi:hypothetical protein
MNPKALKWTTLAAATSRSNVQAAFTDRQAIADTKIRRVIAGGGTEARKPAPSGEECLEGLVETAQQQAEKDHRASSGMARRTAFNSAACML